MTLLGLWSESTDRNIYYKIQYKTGKTLPWTELEQSRTSRKQVTTGKTLLEYHIISLGTTIIKLKNILSSLDKFGKSDVHISYLKIGLNTKY